MNDAMLDTVLNDAMALTPVLMPIFEHLHRHPELSFEEFETTAFIKEQLKKLDLAILDLKMETGVVALLKGNNPHKLVGIRADMDAVPVTEDEAHNVKSNVPGVAHLCGHDFHMTAALGAAMLLKKRQHLLHGDVLFIFQPAEEITRGAQRMVDRGLWDMLPKSLDALFALHVSPHFPTGTVLSSSDFASAAKTNFRIHLRGTTGHSGSPHEYRDVIAVAGQLLNAFQLLVSRANDPLSPLVVAVHTIHAGEHDYFVTDVLEMTGTIRAFDEALQKRTEESVLEIVDKIADLHGIDATVDMIPEVPSQRNHASLREISKRALHRIFEHENILDRPPAFLGAEDFAVFGRDVPSHFYWLGTGFNDKDNALHHQPGFLIDDGALPLGVALLTLSVLESFVF